MAKATVNESNSMQHSFSVSSRSSMQLTGVNEVMSFDETLILLKTVCGNMTISGKDMHVQSLEVEAGNVILTGQIDSVVYSKAGLHGKRTLRDLLR